MKGPTWSQTIVIWRALVGTGLLVYGVVVTARESPASVPYVLVAGMALLGLSITIPLEWKRDQQRDEDE